MEQNVDFFLTLFSNSSFKDFPENKTSSFTVNLPKTINLVGNWEVALAEVIYPQTFENVTEGHNKISFVGTMKVKTNDHEKEYIKLNFEQRDDAPLIYRDFEITCGIYSTQQLIDHINDTISPLVNVEKAFTWKGSHLSLKISEFALKAVPYMEMFLSGNLALQLGYTPHQNILRTKEPRIPDTCFGISPELLIYCDIIEPQIIADTVGQVLSVVRTLDGKNYFGEVIVHRFNVRNYVPIQKKSFKEIKIDIRTVTGEFAPFNFGTSMLLLHFRKLKE